MKINEEKYLIKIDRKSIKKNPNADRTETVVPTNKEIIFEGRKKIPSYLIDGENCCILNWTHGVNGSLLHYRGVLINEELINKILNDPDIRITESEQHFVTVHHFPEENYFYKYKSIQVQCKYCKRKFMSSKLKFYEEESCGCDYGWYNCTDEGCPHCRAWFCCQVEYENINEVIANEYQPEN